MPHKKEQKHKDINKYETKKDLVGEVIKDTNRRVPTSPSLTNASYYQALTKGHLLVKVQLWKKPSLNQAQLKVKTLTEKYCCGKLNYCSINTTRSGHGDPRFVQTPVPPRDVRKGVLSTTIEKKLTVQRL